MSLETHFGPASAGGGAGESCFYLVEQTGRSDEKRHTKRTRGVEKMARRLGGE